MSRFLSLPRELRDEIYDHTLGPRRFTEIHATGRVTMDLSNPQGRHASSAPGLFLANHQIHSEYTERCVKYNVKGPKHADIIYEFHNVDLVAAWEAYPGHTETETAWKSLPRHALMRENNLADTRTLSISLGPECGSRSKTMVEESFVRKMLHILPGVVDPGDRECNAADLTTVVKPDEFKPEDMELATVELTAMMKVIHFWASDIPMTVRCVAG